MKHKQNSDSHLLVKSKPVETEPSSRFIQDVAKQKVAKKNDDVLQLYVKSYGKLSKVQNLVCISRGFTESPDHLL